MSRAIPLGGAEILVNRLDGALKLEVEADGEVYAFTKMGDESSDDIRSLLGESASGADNLAIEIQGLKEGGRLRIYFRTPQRPAPLKVEQMNAPVAVMKIEEADDSDVPLMRKRKLAVSPERPLKKPRRVAPDRVRFYCYNSVEHFALGIMSFDLKSGEITWKPENPNKGVGIRGSSFGRVPVEIPVQKLFLAMGAKSRAVSQQLGTTHGLQVSGIHANGKHLRIIDIHFRNPTKNKVIEVFTQSGRWAPFEWDQQLLTAAVSTCIRLLSKNEPEIYTPPKI